MSFMCMKIDDMQSDSECSSHGLVTRDPSASIVDATDLGSGEQQLAFLSRYELRKNVSYIDLRHTLLDY